MNWLRRLPFVEIWVCDFEYRSRKGNPVEPHTAVFTEVRTDRQFRLHGEDLTGRKEAPIPSDASTLLVCFSSLAEMGCYAALGWTPPERVLDLYAEACLLLNAVRKRPSLQFVCELYGLDVLDMPEKQEMRELAMRGGPYSEEEAWALLEYCARDVRATVAVLERMLSRILGEAADPSRRMHQALLRGTYGQALAYCEHRGIPVHAARVESYRRHWPAIIQGLREKSQERWGLYTEKGSIEPMRYAAILDRNGVPLPATPKGNLSTNYKALRPFTRTSLEIADLYESLAVLSSTKQGPAFVIGDDGRTRAWLDPFSTKTGRNAPKDHFIFAESRYQRGFIKPPPGRFLDYCDYSSQEFVIGACLSGDHEMQAIAQSGRDIYLEMAERLALLPSGATAGMTPSQAKAAYGRERNLAKVLTLGVGYGMSAVGLAQRLDIPFVQARDMYEQHRKVFRTFWGWSDGIVNAGLSGVTLKAPLGWQLPNHAGLSDRTLRNWPAQATGAEILRLAMARAHRSGLELIAPVHDAVLMEGPEPEMPDRSAQLRKIMATAMSDLLDGFPVKLDPAEPVVWPDRYMDPDGAQMWDHLDAEWRKHAPPDEVATVDQGVASPGAGDLPVSAIPPSQRWLDRGGYLKSVTSRGT